MDVIASMLEISGAESLTGSDGRSLVTKVLNGLDGEGSQVGKEAVFSEVNGHTMIFDGRYKLVVDAVTEAPVEFYDVESDPDELDNRVLNPGLKSVREDLVRNYLSQIRERLDESKLKASKIARSKVPPRRG